MNTKERFQQHPEYHFHSNHFHTATSLEFSTPFCFCQTSQFEKGNDNEGLHNAAAVVPVWLSKWLERSGPPCNGDSFSFH